MERLRQFYEWMTQSTRNKVIVGVSLFVLAETAVYLIRRRQLRNEANQKRKKELEVIDRSYVMEKLAEQPSTSYEQENPLLGHSQEVMDKFLEKLRNSERLRRFFKEEMLQRDSSYARNLQIHVMNSMGGPYQQFEVNLKKLHKGLNITREDYLEWVRLWQQSQRQVGVASKDIWGQLQEQIVY